MFIGGLELYELWRSVILPRCFLQTLKQVPVVWSTDDAVATPAGHSSANVVSNQPRTVTRFLQNILY